MPSFRRSRPKSPNWNANYEVPSLNTRGPDKWPRARPRKFWNGYGAPRFPAKLAREDVIQIRGILLLDRRERRAAGYERGTRGLRKRLAQHYRVSIWCIEAVAKRRRWRHVRIKVMQKIGGQRPFLGAMP